MYFNTVLIILSRRLSWLQVIICLNLKKEIVIPEMRVSFIATVTINKGK